MKLKRLLALLLTLVMIGSVTACGNSTVETKEDESAAQTETIGAQIEAVIETQQSADEELYEIVMQIITLGNDPSGLRDVENAINEIVGPQIGVKVTLYPIFIYDIMSQTNLMLTSGDKLDLIANFYGSMTSLVDKGALLPLDDLYAQYGQDIALAEGIAMAGGYYNGQLYGIPSEEKHGRRYGFMARTDILEELGFEVDENKTYDLEYLEEIFAAYKEKYGEGYYCVAGTSASADFFTFTTLVDQLGASASCGVLMGAGLDGNMTVENLYESDAYKAWADRTYQWAQAGYYSPDAATNTDSAATQLQSGYYLGGFSGTETDMKANCSRDYGYPMTVINLTDVYAATHMYQISSWSIPANCENPEKTFQFLNFLYADNDLDNILTNGLEGVSYEYVEKGEKAGQGVIRYAEGVDAANSPYTMAHHIYGDKLSIGVYEPLTLDYYEQGKAFNESITDAQKSATLGYVFNASSVASQKAAVTAVVRQYTGMITCGAQDPAVLLPEFWQALDDAGIEEIIAENQKQLDEWLAANK